MSEGNHNVHLVTIYMYFGHVSILVNITLPTESVFGVRMLHVLTESGTKRASVWRVSKY